MPSHPSSPPISKLSLRPTPVGYWLALISAAFFAEAYMHNLNLAYIALFTLLPPALLSWPVALANLKKVRLLCRPRERLFANTPATLYLTPAAKDRIGYGVTLRLNDTRVPLPLSAERTVPVAFTPTQRGVIEDLKIELFSYFPLGLFRAHTTVPLPCRLTVYPQPRGMSLEQSLTGRPAPFGTEGEFDGIAPTDGRIPPSRIHWPSMAKGALMAKRFSAERADRALSFDFDNLAGDTQTRLEQLTLWILECERLGYDFTLKLGGRRFDSKKETVDEILTALATFKG